MPSSAVISIKCKDRIGLIATVSETIVDMGGKILDMTAFVLGKGIVIVALSLWLDKEPPVSELRKHINELSGLETADVEVNTFELLPFAMDSVEMETHRIRCLRLHDKRSDLEALLGMFAEFNANLIRVHAVRYKSEKGWELAITMGANIPEKETKACLEALNDTAKDLGYALEVQAEKITG